MSIGCRIGGIAIAKNKFGPVSDVAFVTPSSPSTANTSPAIRPVREITHHQHDTPKDAVPLVAGDGQRFVAPSSADLAAVFAAGQVEGLMGMGANVGWWGKFDFQRDGETCVHPYTNASNYAVGAYLAGAGCTWSETYLIANTFAHTMSSNARSQAQEAWWARGWNDATNKTGPFSHQWDCDALLSLQHTGFGSPDKLLLPANSLSLTASLFSSPT